MANLDPIQAEPVSSRSIRLLFSTGMTLLLIAIAVIGQVARSNFFSVAFERLRYGDRPVIAVMEASYGLNCRDFPEPATIKKWTDPGNVTGPLKRACDGQPLCSYTVNASELGDPASECGKDFSVEYRCIRPSAANATDGKTRSEFLAPEAHGKVVNLGCGEETSPPRSAAITSSEDVRANSEHAKGIDVVTATYGLNCRDFPVPPDVPKRTTPGNVSEAVKKACNGRDRCSFAVDHYKIGDPARGCAKDFAVQYLCPSSTEPKIATLDAEAEGKTAELACPGAND